MRSVMTRWVVSAKPNQNKAKRPQETAQVQASEREERHESHSAAGSSVSTAWAREHGQPSSERAAAA